MSRAEGVRAEPGAFAVETPVFTGPFRALAELLLGRKVDVCDVPLRGVVDAFVALAPEAGGRTLEEQTWFVVTCATLLEMKVARLTPRDIEPDEEDLVGGSPDLAYARRLELSAFREAAREVARWLEDGGRRFGRGSGPGEEFAHLYPDVMDRVTADGLARIAADLLRPPPAVDLSHVAPIRVTVAEALALVADRLATAREASFRDLVADAPEPIHVVVRFLALLELYRDGRVSLRQARTFGEIQVTWEEREPG